MIEKPHVPYESWLPFRHRALNLYLNDPLPSKILVFHLLATGFTTGILDATTYVDYGTFTSNQTGNTVLIGIRLLGLSDTKLIDPGTSLASFFLSAVIFGQLAIYLDPTQGRTRWWVLSTSMFQAILNLIVPILAYAGVINITQKWAWLTILLLASSAGAQVTMAKQFQVPEIPTAMLTSPMADLATDPHLFTRTFTKAHNVPRSRRAGYILLFVVGVFVGAAFHKHSGTVPVLLLAGVLKLVVSLSIVFVPKEVDLEKAQPP